MSEGGDEMMTADDLITIPEAAKILGLARQTLYTELRAWRVPKFRKTGPRVYVPRKAIEAIKEERERFRPIDG